MLGCHLCRLRVLRGLLPTRIDRLTRSLSTRSSKAKQLAAAALAAKAQAQAQAKAHQAQAQAQAQATAAPAAPARASPWWVGYINSSLTAAPMFTVVSNAALDAAGMAVMFGLYYGSGIDIPVELPLALGLSRLLRRLRLPLDVAMAALLARAVPALTEVRIIEAMQMRASAAPPTTALGRLLAPTSALGRLVDALQLRASAAPPTTALGRLLAGAGAMVNRYGLAYMAASRVGGLATVGAIFAALHAGVDVQGALNAVPGWDMLSSGPASAGSGMGALNAVPGWDMLSSGPAGAGSGMGAAVGKAAGCWAAAVLTAAPLLPLNLLAAAWLGRRRAAALALK